MVSTVCLGLEPRFPYCLVAVVGLAVDTASVPIDRVGAGAGAGAGAGGAVDAE